jgi:hypothetical protein
VGAITRGTTNPNRLRRMDRWLAGPQAWRIRGAKDPLVVDLGYGATPVTAVELFTRLRTVRTDVEVVGVEIDPERVRAAQPLERSGLRFVQGGFEVPLDGRRPVVVRAFNVLRQYGEAAAWSHWDLMRSRIAPRGIIVEGTCSEIGHRAVWAALGAEGPRTLTFSARFAGFGRHSDLAERLPKTLIHRNVPGEPVHRFLADWDRAWAVCAPFGAYGARQRWIKAAQLLAADWPVTTTPPAGGVTRWRLGELTIPWAAVAPHYGT